MKSILLVAYGGGHVAMLAPVVKVLAEQNRPFIFLALTTAKSALEQLGISSIGFCDLPEATDPAAQVWGCELARSLPTGGVVTQQESIAYLGANFRDLVDQYGEIVARRLYAAQGRQAFLPVATLKRVIKRLNPSLVVATNAPRAERAAILAAGQLGIPSICAIDLFALQEVQWIGQPGYGTRLCVLNESVRQMFIERGRKSEEVVITGNPAFEKLTATETRLAGARLRQERGWNDGRKVILWASQIEPDRHPFSDLIGDPSLPRRVEQELRNLVARDSRLRLVVRYHPSERVEFVSAPGVEFSPVSDPIATVLHAVDLVVVTASTVGLEAAIAGRPVLSVDSSVFTPDTRYAITGVSQGVQGVEEIAPAIDKVLTGKVPIFTQGRLGGSATQEILQVIDSLLV